MFDFLRNLTKSAEEKRQEMLAGYIDGSLSPAERQQFEEMLTQDPGLQAQLEQQQTVRQMLSQLPQRRVPRTFTLDPAQYGRPAKQPFVQYYPALRAATVMTAVLLFFVVGLNLFTFSGSSDAMPASNIALEPLMSDDSAAGYLDVIEEEAAAEEMPAEEEAVEQEAAEEEMAEEEMAEEAMEEEAEAAMGETADSAAEPPEIAETAPASLAPEEDEEDMEAADGASAPTATLQPLPTASAAGTQTAVPIATQSTLPRVAATAVPERVVTKEADATELAYAFEPTIVPLPESDMDETLDDTAVTETEIRTISSEQQQIINLITMVQVGLFLLLVVLVGLTLYARRQF